MFRLQPLKHIRNIKTHIEGRFHSHHDLMAQVGFQHKVLRLLSGDELLLCELRSTDLLV